MTDFEIEAEALADLAGEYQVSADCYCDAAAACAVQAQIAAEAGDGGVKASAAEKAAEHHENALDASVRAAYALKLLRTKYAELQLRKAGAASTSADEADIRAEEALAEAQAAADKAGAYAERAAAPAAVLQRIGECRKAAKAEINEWMKTPLAAAKPGKRALRLVKPAAGDKGPTAETAHGQSSRTTAEARPRPFRPGTEGAPRR